MKVDRINYELTVYLLVDHISKDQEALLISLIDEEWPESTTRRFGGGGDSDEYQISLSGSYDQAEIGDKLREFVKKIEKEREPSVHQDSCMAQE